MQQDDQFLESTLHNLCTSTAAD